MALSDMAKATRLAMRSQNQRKHAPRIPNCSRIVPELLLFPRACRSPEVLKHCCAAGR